MKPVLCLLMPMAVAAIASAAPQSYSNPGLSLQFPLKQQPYLQAFSPQYVTAPQQATPVFEGAEQSFYVPQQYTQQQPQPIQQVLLPSAVDRQASISYTCSTNFVYVRGLYS